MPNSEFNRIAWQEAPSVYVCACVVGGVWVGVLTRLLARLPLAPHRLMDTIPLPISVPHLHQYATF